MQRDEHIDVAKALAISFVVLGHCLDTPVIWQQCLRHYICSFHMAMFFFLSGLFFKEKYCDEKLSFIWRKIRGLWWPSVKWTIVFVLLHNFFCAFHCYGTFRGCPPPAPYSVRELLRALILALTLRSGTQLIGGFWFLPTLFYAALLSLFSVWGTRALLPPPGERLRYGMIILGFSLAASLMLALRKGIPMFMLPNMGYTTMLAAALFTCGAFFKIARVPQFVGSALFVMLATSLLLVLPNIHQVSLTTLRRPYEAFYALLTGLIGAISWVTISGWLLKALKRDGLKWLLSLILSIGRNTLAILALHFLCFKVVNYLKVFLYGLPIENVGAFPILIDGDPSVNGIGWVVLYLVAGVLLPILIVYLYGRVKAFFFSLIRFPATV